MSLSNIKLVKLTVFKLKLPSCWEIGSETEITTTAWIVSKLTFLSSKGTAGVQIWDFENIFTWRINCISGRDVFGWIIWQRTTALGWHKFGSSFSTFFTLDIILSSACLCVKWVLVKCCHLLGAKRIQLGLMLYIYVRRILQVKYQYEAWKLAFVLQISILSICIYSNLYLS